MYPLTLDRAAKMFGPLTRFVGVERNERGQEISDYVWTCDGCGKKGPWGPTWEWYGSDLMCDEGRMSQARVSCSAACQAASRAAKVNQNWKNIE